MASSISVDNVKSLSPTFNSKLFISINSFDISNEKGHKLHIFCHYEFYKLNHF